MLHFSKIGNKTPELSWFKHSQCGRSRYHVFGHKWNMTICDLSTPFSTKFGADISICGPDMPGKQNWKWRPLTAFLWQTGQSVTKLLWFICFQYGHHQPSCIRHKLILTIPYTLGPQCLLTCQIWHRYLDPELRYALYTKFKMTVAGVSVQLQVLVYDTCPRCRIGQCTLSFCNFTDFLDGCHLPYWIILACWTTHKTASCENALRIWHWCPL